MYKNNWKRSHLETLFNFDLNPFEILLNPFESFWIKGKLLSKRLSKITVEVIIARFARNVLKKDFLCFLQTMWKYLSCLMVDCFLFFLVVLLGFFWRRLTTPWLLTWQIWSGWDHPDVVVLDVLLLQQHCEGEMPNWKACDDQHWCYWPVMNLSRSNPIIIFSSLP